MQCYEILAAATLVANEIDRIPGLRHHLPLSVIADWMAENDIEPADVLFGDRDPVLTKVAALARQQQPAVLHAA